MIEMLIAASVLLVFGLIGAVADHATLPDRIEEFIDGLPSMQRYERGGE